MDSSISDPIPEDPVGAQLDNEIASLHSQSKQPPPIPPSPLTSSVSALKSQRGLQVSTILSSHIAHSTLSRLQATQSKQKPNTTDPTDTSPLLATATAQQAHKTENLYRTCAGITTFTIQDPDPNAVDSGHVLGIRIDVSSGGKFIRPYYMFLNKPFSGEQAELLRIHRHTLPSCIPLTGLVNRWLPNGKGATAMGSAGGGKKQDLTRFTRALRREIVGYHNRISTIKSLRKEFSLDEKASKKGKGREKVIADISAADAEAKQVRIEWVDGRIGRCVVDEKGEVMKCVVIGEGGRDWEIERRVVSGDMADIGEKLRAGIY